MDPPPPPPETDLEDLDKKSLRVKRGLELADNLDELGQDQVADIVRDVVMTEPYDEELDPEDFVDHAFVICTSPDEKVNYERSRSEEIWATTATHTPIIKQAYDDWVRRRKSQPLLIATSYPPRDPGAATNKHIHGVMLVTGQPTELKSKSEITDEEARKDPWAVKGKYHSYFTVKWLVWCRDKLNLMTASYALSQKRDMQTVEKGLAREIVIDLKRFVGCDNHDYVKKDAGSLIFARLKETIKKDTADAQEGEDAKRRRRRPPIEIKYEEEARAPLPEAVARPPQQHLPDEIQLNEMSDIAKIFGTPKPPLDYWDPTLNDIHFEVVDQDYCDMPSLDPRFNANGDVFIEDYASPIAPVLRLYGATKEGYSVVAMVRGFSPYFFVRAPDSIVDLLKYTKYNDDVKAQLDREAKEYLGREDFYDPENTLLGKIATSMEAKGCCHAFRDNLSKELEATFDNFRRKAYGYDYLPRQYRDEDDRGYRARLDEALAKRADPPVLKVILVRREGLIGYRPHLSWFLKITVISPHFVKPARTILESGSFLWFVNDKGLPVPGVAPQKYQVFEGNIPFAMRYMLDIEQMGPCWVTIPKGRYMRWDCTEEERATYADIEILSRESDVKAHPCSDPQWADHAPVRSLLFDCEMDGRDGRFPRSDLQDGDPVICIGARVCNEVPDQSKQVVGDLLFSWGLTADSKVAHMLCYYKKRYDHDIDEMEADLCDESPRIRSKFRRCGSARIKRGVYAYWTPQEEKLMLQQFRDFIIHIARPHVISGYNVNNFDLPYLFTRAAFLGLGQEFDCIGWIKGQRTKVKTRIFSSKMCGNRVNHELNIPGRVVADCLHIIQRNFKQRGYSLNASLARHMGNDEKGNPKYIKADVPHEMIGYLWSHSEDSRARVAYYCHYDVVLSHLLFQKLFIWLDASELARAAGVPIKFVIERGLQIAVLSLLLRKAKQYLLVAPVEADDKTKVDDEKYKGATVIDPIPGFYSDPVITLDFTSLYPTIMIAHNLCYSTIITIDDLLNMPKHLLYQFATDQGLMQFVKQNVRMGIFPMVLEGLLAARNEAKAGAALHKGTSLGKVYDLRQNALKLRANAGYGMAGASRGMLPCRGISASVTKIGRFSIDTVAQMVTRPYLPFPRSFVEFDYQYHARVGTAGWPFDTKSKDPAVKAAASAARTEYLRNRLPESEEQWRLRCKDAIAAFPIPRLEGESIEDHQKRILAAIDFIYGDTDSLMVLCKMCKSAEEAINLGLAFANWVTKYGFHAPMAILFEKIYYPFILFAKKRYAGVLWTKPEKPDKRDAKGLESVRRDNAPVAANMVDNLVDSLLKDKSFEKAVRMVMKVVQSILDGSVDVSMLVISKSLSKEAKDYDQSAPHVTLTRKMQMRDLNTAPRMGDRVPFVMISRGGKGKDTKAHEKAEDPLWAIEHDLLIDREYYLMKQLYNPVERILEPLLPGITSRLFSTSPSTVYLPPTVDMIAKKLLSSRTSTGADEGVLAMSLTATSSEVGAASASVSAPAPIAAAPKPKKPAAKTEEDKRLAKLIPGQMSVTALFNGLTGSDAVLKSLDAETIQRKKPAARGVKEQISGQTNVAACLAHVSQSSSESNSSGGCGTPKPRVEFVKPPSHDITKPMPGYIPVNIRYRVKMSTPVKSKDSIGQYGVIRPKCISCNAIITASLLSEEDLKHRVVAPVCVPCRKDWERKGKDIPTELRALQEKYGGLKQQADSLYKELWNICVGCQKVKAIEDVPECAAKDCKNFYPRTSAKVKRTEYDNTLLRLNEHAGGPCCGAVVAAPVVDVGAAAVVVARKPND